MNEAITNSELENQQQNTYAEYLGHVSISHTGNLEDLPEQRAEELQQLVDPEKTLPVIFLIRNTDSEKAVGLSNIGYSMDLAYASDGKEIGEIQTHTVEYEKNVIEVTYTNTTKKGQGYGMAMYLAVAIDTVRQGKALINDQSGVSADAKRVWEKLETYGAASAIKPFVRDLSRKRETYIGKYRI
jgi:predicted GNAT family acetyltransferase